MNSLPCQEPKDSWNELFGFEEAVGIIGKQKHTNNYVDS
jgi:hypothetical protein